MPAAAQNYSLGLQVEVAKIDNELKKLWQEGAGAMTRASLINLAVYSEEPGSLEKNTQLVAKITEDHACRALVIFADHSAQEDRVDAWISAHCHVTRAGSTQVCSEQLSFWLQGHCAKLLPSIVFSHVDSDLPLYLWWQGEFHDPMDPQLWAWVDRLLYDSHSWKNFADQLRLIETAQREARQRIVLCDLNWMRLDKIRFAVAQFFDHPASHHHFGKIRSAQIQFTPGFKSTAVLFAGWLGAQLNWRVDSANGAAFQFADANGRKIDIELRENDGPPIGKIVINSTEAEFSVAPAQCGDLLEISRSRPNEQRAGQLMPAQCYDLADLMTQELLRGGPHHIYLRAINCVRDLL
ncbi:MAG TPA: glucose-6-phosphate dehydrogenase assembly protein OpcA [Chthoniobacterales bacterium]|nr:glucose-6-phosphate dehydrogenase assembly protein OpcA [Chthoniobacterales bacterium]